MIVMPVPVCRMRSTSAGNRENRFALPRSTKPDQPRAQSLMPEPLDIILEEQTL